MSESAGWEYARKLIAAEKVAGTGTLDLGSLGLTDLPEELFELQDLKQLNLGSAVRDAAEIWVHSENNYYINDIGENLAKLKRLLNLVDLSLDNTDLSSVLSLSSLTYLRSLDFRYTQVSDLTPLTGMTQLQSLDCYNTQVSDLTPLAGLTQLQSLNCTGTQVSDLTPLAGMTQLQSLNCWGTQVSDLTQLAGLTQLQSLNCWNTQVSDLTQLAGLTQLQSLNCWNTQVSDLTPLAGMTGLKEIRLTDTKIETIPEWLVRLPHLEKLYISSPNVRGIPAEILTKAWNDNCLDRLRAHFDDLAKGVERFTDVKMIVIGNGQIGKTKICKQLIFNYYDQSAESTHGIVVRPVEKWSLDDVPGRTGEHARLNLWDFGGQDLYHGTHTLFLNSRSIFMIVWTPESEEAESHTFDGMSFPNHKLPYWLENVRHAAGTDQPVIIVQNQCDTAEQEKPLPPVDSKLLDSFKHKKICHYSAKENRNRAILKNIISEAISQNWQRRGDTEIGKGRMRVIREIEKLRKTNPDGKNRTMQRAEFEKLCNSPYKLPILNFIFRKLIKPIFHIRSDVSSPEMLLKFLNDTGILIYRPNLFKGEIIIDQNWALEAVYAVFDRKKSYDVIKRMGGKFKRTDLQTMVWQSYSTEEQELFLSWMVSCGNCFVYKGGNHYDDTETVYMAPELLPRIDEVQQELDKDWESITGCPEVIKTFHVPFLHPGLIQGLIVEIGKLGGPNPIYWREGFCFYDSATQSRAFVEQELVENVKNWSGRLHLRTKGTGAAKLFSRMQSWLFDITRRLGNAQDLLQEELSSGKSNIDETERLVPESTEQQVPAPHAPHHSEKQRVSQDIGSSQFVVGAFPTHAQIGLKASPAMIDIAILTPMQKEFEAVLNKFDQEPRTEIVNGKDYSFRTLTTQKGRKYSIAVKKCSGQGNAISQAEARGIIDDLKPKWILLVGIAGGRPTTDFSLLDVVASSWIYDFNRMAVKDGEFEFDPAGGSIHHLAQSKVANISGRLGEMGDWSSEENVGMKRPEIGFKPEMIYQEIDEEDWKKKIEASLKAAAKREKVQVWSESKFGSSDLLIKDMTVLKARIKVARKVDAVEMEAAGVLLATDEKHIPFFSIRGISDIVGYKRDDSYTEYAARIAAAFTHAYLKTEPF